MGKLGKMIAGGLTVFSQIMRKEGVTTILFPFSGAIFEWVVVRTGVVCDRPKHKNKD